MIRPFWSGLLLSLAVILPAPHPVQAQGNPLSDVAKILLGQELDRIAWAEAQQANTVAGYRSYLQRFPNGLHKAEAEAALAKLGAPVTPPVVVTPPAQPVDPDRPWLTAAQVEGLLGLSRAQRAEIQQQLTALGHDTRGADGLWGTNTRAAISAWQTANRQIVTGYVTGPQVALIARQFAALPAPRPPQPGDPEQVERALNLSAPERREIQLRLTLLGHSTQGTNGTFGPLTRRAIEDWQRQQRVAVTGFLTAEQVRMLQRQTGG